MESNATTITLEEAQKFSKNVVFIGINKPSSKHFSKIEEERNKKVKKLEKWYHHGKIEWQSCTSQCDVDYEWKTAYRWHSSWKFKASGTLTDSNNVTEFYYSNYRIKTQILYFGLSNFGLFEKHWVGDNWRPVNY